MSPLFFFLGGSAPQTPRIFLETPYLHRNLLDRIQNCLLTYQFYGILHQNYILCCYFIRILWYFSNWLDVFQRFIWGRAKKKQIERCWRNTLFNFEKFLRIPPLQKEVLKILIIPPLQNGHFSFEGGVSLVIYTDFEVLSESKHKTKTTSR